MNEEEEDRSTLMLTVIEEKMEVQIVNLQFNSIQHILKNIAKGKTQR